MTRQAPRRTRPTPFVDPTTRRQRREQQLAENRLDTIRSQAPLMTGRY